MITDFHAKYFAYELGRRCSSDSVEKLTAVLADAQVDLNPHQIEAALFAFRSPFSKGAILADEVGLGKTKEPHLRQTAWDLIVIDEAHRLRNVYRGSGKIATAIKQAVTPFLKVLPTATPLQNTLLEL